MGEELVHFALAFDQGALIGAHVTMRTVLRHLTRSCKAVFHCYGPPISEEDLGQIHDTLRAVGTPYTLEFTTLTPERFSHLKWQGGFTTYLRLLIPTMIPAPRVIYLDSDLLVYANLAELWRTDLAGNALGAVSWDNWGSSNDSALCKHLGFDPRMPYFNAGVLLVDCDAWRAGSLTDQSLEVAEREKNHLPSAEQTILNIVFYNSVTLVPRRFNTPVDPGRPCLSAADRENRVIHLVSHPKPWELFGGLHGQFRLFVSEAKSTALPRYRIPLGLPAVNRMFRYSRAYLKCVKGRLLSPLRR